MSANWKAAKEDLEWSLNLGDDVKGREELKPPSVKKMLNMLGLRSMHSSRAREIITRYQIFPDVHMKMINVSTTWEER